VKRIVSGLLIAAVVASGCEGPFVDVSAARVDGVDIEIDAVRELAAAPEVVQQAQNTAGLVQVDDGALGGGSARVALGFLLQTELLSAATRWVGLDVAVPPSANDASGQSLSAEVSAVQDRFSAYSQALAGQSPDDEVLDAFLASQDDFLDGGVCIEGVGVPTEAADAIAQVLASGATFGDVATQLSTQVQVFGTEDAPACVGLSALPSQDLEDLLATGPIGTTGTVELESNAGGTDTLFIRPVSRGDERDAAIERRWATGFFAAQDSSVSAWISAMTQLVDVEVDPRFGDLDISDQVGVVAPPSPTVRGTTAELLGI
jgi:hypothetical protein